MAVSRSLATCSVMAYLKLLFSKLTLHRRSVNFFFCLNNTRFSLLLSNTCGAKYLSFAPVFVFEHTQES
jgi:hypothetical protein